MANVQLNPAVRNSSIQSVVNTKITIIHPGLNGGAATTLTGLRLEGNIADAEQEIENVKRVPLIDGSTIALINGATFGTLSLSASRISPTTSAAATDLVMCFTQIQKSGLNTVGAQISITYEISTSMTGGTPSKETWQFIGAIAKKVPPLKLAGNDVPVYTIPISYDDYSVSVSA